MIKNKKILIDISRLHPLALKRGVGIYATSLFTQLKRSANQRQYILKKDKQSSAINIDLVHYPFFDPFFLTLKPDVKTPFLVTVHDLIPLKFPQHYPAGVKGRLKFLVQKFWLKKAQVIITDSQNSQKDIVQILGYPAKKVFSIPLAVSKEFKQIKQSKALDKIKKKYKLGPKFILYVGDLNWNKNLSGLLQAFSQLNDLSLKLVLVGKAFEQKKLLPLQKLERLMVQLNIKDRIIKLGFIPNKELALIYNLALFYIQPSFYEGFGLPVLEAMSCGCSVLSSNQASLPEIGGQAVLYFNPYKSNDLTNKMKFLLDKGKTRKQLEQKGIKQSQKFSWEQTAKETEKIYQKVLNHEN